MNVHGSTILYVTVIMSVIMVGLTNAWWNAYFSSDIARKRERYEQYWYATQGIINVGCAVCQQHIHYLMRVPYEPVYVEYRHWPCGGTTDYTATITIVAKNARHIHINASLVKDTMRCLTMRCIIGVDDDQQLQVQERAVEYGA